MKIRAVILAGGEGTRLGVLTAKRTKPAVPFAGKYRIIDFPLSNCVNSNIFDVMIVAQYRPQSLIEHIGAGGPWDLNRDFTGGVRIFTPYKASSTSWFVGTADAIQQNFSFIKGGSPDIILILSGDHVYDMDYEAMVRYHLEKGAQMTMATISVPMDEASRFGIVGVEPDNRVVTFVEKPAKPPSSLANMGVYLFNTELLDHVLWEDHLRSDSSHDFGKDIIPRLIKSGEKVYAYPYNGYWVDVGTVNSYWQAHMDLLTPEKPINLFDRDWVIHTRTEERAPSWIEQDAKVEDSMICNGCIIKKGARVVRSVLSPGVIVESGALVEESIILTDSVIGANSTIRRAILDKRVMIGSDVKIGDISGYELQLAMVGKNSTVPNRMVIQPGGMVGTDVTGSDYYGPVVESGVHVHTRRLPNEI
jgi:glucose-1-phosphate adenylyltransferase